jgi:hypothetical protein
MWESNYFVAVWRVLLTILNAAGTITCAITLQLLRKQRLSHNKKAKSSLSSGNVLTHTSLFIRNSTIATAAVFLEFVACSIRCIYCAGGPQYSHGLFTVTDHRFLMHVTLPLEIMVSLLAAILFIRWGALGTPETAQRHETFLLVIFIIALPLALATSAIHDSGIFIASFIVVIDVALMGAVCGMTTCLFLVYGYRFIRSLKSTLGSAKNITEFRKERLMWATQWTVLSSFMRVVVLVGTAVAATPGFLYNPLDWFTCYTLVYIGITGQALTQVISFIPRSQTRNPMLPVITVTPFILSRNRFSRKGVRNTTEVKEEVYDPQKLNAALNVTTPDEQERHQIKKQHSKDSTEFLNVTVTPGSTSPPLSISVTSRLVPPKDVSDWTIQRMQSIDRKRNTSRTLHARFSTDKTESDVDVDLDVTDVRVEVVPNVHKQFPPEPLK